MDRMRTEQERVKLLHIRARELRRRREGWQMAGLGSVSVVLTVLMLFTVRQMSGIPQYTTGDPFTGSSLLNENTGGYVLVMVISFFVGVILTALIFRYRKKK